MAGTSKADAFCKRAVRCTACSHLCRVLAIGCLPRTQFELSDIMEFSEDESDAGLQSL